ncbi:MAG: DUF6544 family protein [Acidimicrobiales bacterium]
MPTGAPAGAGATAPVTEDDLAKLPAPVVRYLRFMGLPGRPRDWSFRARFRGRFRLRPGQRWMPLDAWQYNGAVDVVRIFEMRLRFAGVVPMVGSDTYLRGHGRMLGKLANVVTVADGQGPEFDAGELSSWVNDAVLLAPSMLLGPATGWAGVDDRSFDVTFSDAGLTVRARVSLDDRGAPVNFSTTDRYAALPGGPVRARWTTPIAGWEEVGGRPVPTGGAAVWHLEDGDFTYAEARFVPGTVEYNVGPGRG